MLTRLMALTIPLLLVLALPAMATPCGARHDHGPEGFDDPREHRRQDRQQLVEKLELTPEQARQLRDIRHERRTQMAPLRERCRHERTALRQTFHDRLSALLTPAQREQWEKMRDRGPQRHNQHAQGAWQNF